MVIKMGDRGQVLIKSWDGKKGVYLYTHWGATRLVKNVERAIKKKWRWDDPSYLARIIFDVMTEDSHGEETGYGIDAEMHGDIWRLIIVDCNNRTVEVRDYGKHTSKKTFAEIAEIGATN
jgi:hypothetical protein